MNIKKNIKVLMPHQKINLFTLFIIGLGFLSGIIFLLAINKADKTLVEENIVTFFSNINNNKINNITIFKNVFWENIIIVSLIFVLGLSIIGVIFNIFLIYFKSFTIGFTLTSILYIYKYKGLLAGFIYLFPVEFINIFILLLMCTESIVLTKKLWELIFFRNKNINLSNNLKKYFIIYIITILLSLISSLLEAYLVPSLLKVVVKLFIK